ncbi:MAG: tRNA dihydrouridine synthase DusB [Clostridiaceae bacterium]
MKISNLEFKNNIFLAPLAGVSDKVFRKICSEMGSGLCYTEMVSAKGLYYGSENTKELLSVLHGEKKAAAQIFGSDPYIMAKTCDKLNEREDIVLIDINMGCPVQKIVKNGEGSALMKDIDLACDIVKQVKKASVKPVTVKIRKGFDEQDINAVEFSKALEQAGADAIAVHGRTRQQMYSGKSDMEIIKKVKDILSIPVIGNGDIFNCFDAKNMMEYTNCDGIMVARGALGNPFIFKQINKYFETGEILKIKDFEKIEMAIKHLSQAVEEFGEKRAVREMRKHINWYIKGINNATKVKNLVNVEQSYEKVIFILEEYKHNLENI